MYQFTFDQDTTKKLNSSTSNSKTIFEKFTEVDNKYNNLNSSAEELNLKKLEYQKPSTQEVEQTAKNSLETYKNSSLNSINQTFDEKNNSIDKSIEKAKESSQNQQNSIVSAFSEAKTQAKDDAIKRGLARSSIIVNTLANYDSQMLENLAKETKDLSDKISEFNGEKALLEEQKKSALESFDIEYAVKLQDKINQLNQDIYEKEKEITEYNNKIAETEAKWKKDADDTVYDKTMDMAELMAKYGISVFDVLKQNEKYEIAKAHFNSMNKDEALEEFTNNSNYISQLGNSLYNKLLKELQDK